MPETTPGIFKRLKKRFVQLTGFHGKHRSHKEKDLVVSHHRLTAVNEVTSTYNIFSYVHLVMTLILKLLDI